ncbi:MAG: hypothetical protein ACK450_04340 [Sphingomonadales bacterium]|jgi:hypothetical protein
MRVLSGYSSLTVLVVLAACGSSGGDAGYDDYQYAQAVDEPEVDVEERDPFDEDAARDETEREIGFETYTGIGSPYGCTDDCSGHEAGFKWRRDRGYVPYGNSDSFREGAQAYEDEVERRVEEKREAYENGEDLDF